MTEYDANILFWSLVACAVMAHIFKLPGAKQVCAITFMVVLFVILRGLPLDS